MKKWIIAAIALLAPAQAWSIGDQSLGNNFRVLLRSSNTWTAWEIFHGSVTFDSAKMGINGVKYTWPGSDSNGCLKDDGAGNLTWASCGSGGGSGSASTLLLMPSNVLVSTLNFPTSDFQLVSDGAGSSTPTWRGTTGTVTASQIYTSSVQFRFIYIGTGTGGMFSLSTTPNITSPIVVISTDPTTNLGTLFEINLASAIWNGRFLIRDATTINGTLASGPLSETGIASPGGTTSAANILAKFQTDGSGSADFFIRRKSGTATGPIALVTSGSTSRGLQLKAQTGGTTVGEPGDIIITTPSAAGFTTVNIGGYDIRDVKFHVDGGTSAFTVLAFIIGASTSGSYVFVSSNVGPGISLMRISTNPWDAPALFDLYADSLALKGIALELSSGVTIIAGNKYIWQSTAPQSGDCVWHLNGGRIFCGGDATGSGGVPDNFGSHVATQPVIIPFGITIDSGIVKSSWTVMGPIISTSPALLGGATVQGDFTQKGTSCTITNTTNYINGVTVFSGPTNADLVDISSGGALTNAVSISSNNYISIASSSSHVLSGCGISPAIYGGGSAFTIIPGATAGGCTITFGVPFKRPPITFVSQRTLSLTNSLSYTVTNTSLILTETSIGVVDVLLVGADNW